MKLIDAIDQALRVGPIGPACRCVWLGSDIPEDHLQAALELGGGNIDLDILAKGLGYDLTNPLGQLTDKGLTAEQLAAFVGSHDISGTAVASLADVELKVGTVTQVAPLLVSDAALSQVSGVVVNQGEIR